MSGRVTSSGKCRRSARTGCGEACLGGAEPLRDAGQIPHRIDRDLDHRQAAVGVNRRPSAFSRPAASASRISIRSSRARVIAMVGRMSSPSAISVLECSATQVAPRIERDDPLGLAPLRERADRRGRMGIGEVGPPDRIEHARRHRERAVERIGAAVAADHVAQPGLRHRADHRPAFARGRRAPMDGKAHFRPPVGMRGEPDVVRSVRRIHRERSKRPTARHDDGPTGQRFSI